MIFHSINSILRKGTYKEKSSFNDDEITYHLDKSEI